VAIDELADTLTTLMDTIQVEMLERARVHREEHTYDAHSYDEFKDIVANKPGFVRGMWCESVECENKIKEDTTATSRCMPFMQERIGGKCVCCGEPAVKMVYWGKAY
jgi:prolyl-tRNA synthetase